jgi:hypothetical protein
MLLQLAAVPVKVTFEESSWAWLAHWDFWLTIFTFGLTLCTAWLAWETRNLRIDGAKAIKAAIKNAEEAARSAEASTQSAEAARMSAATARESMERSLRPYVLVDGLKFSYDQGALARPIACKLEIVNTGQTPAINVVVRTRFLVANRPPTIHDLNDLQTSQSVVGIVGSGQKASREVLFGISPDDAEIDSWLARSQSLFVLGRITYFDPIADKERHTVFCHEGSAETKTFLASGSTLNTIT